MKIIKRSGSEVPFDIDKIVNAIKAANNEVPQNERLTDEQVALAAHSVEWLCGRSGQTVSVEEIQDMVEDQIMAQGRYTVARKYIIYRYVQSLKRHSNTTDDKILSLIECNNEEAKQENSNKNPTVNSVQRDYMARCPRTSRCACCFRPRWCARTTKASSTSTILTTSRSICTTATW